MLNIKRYNKQTNKQKMTAWDPVQQSERWVVADSFCSNDL